MKMTNKLCAAKRLAKVQSDLIAPKNQLNKFGGYKYRSQEDILQAVKPLLAKNDLYLILEDEIVNIGNRYYVKVYATIYDAIDNVPVAANSAYAREPESKKGMDESQITGTASSYARKYALNGILLIDDTKDADTDEHHKVTKSRDDMPKALIQSLEKYDEEELKQIVAENKSEFINSMSAEDKMKCKQAGYNDFTVIGLAYLVSNKEWAKALSLLGVK